jgi:hypothetical protein
LYIIHKKILKNSLDLQGRIRKPSKRKEGVDPLLPITPARPPKTIPVPFAPVSFASRRIQGSQNRAAAAVLFTPRANTAKQHHGPVPANQYPPPSPTPQRGQSPLKSVLTLSSDNSPPGSDIEDEVRIALEKLDLHSQSSSHSRSGSQSPRAGPHSTQHRAQRPKGGANDVWKFFEKSSARTTCVFCKYVHYFPRSHADI